MFQMWQWLVSCCHALLEYLRSCFQFDAGPSRRGMSQVPCNKYKAGFERLINEWQLGCLDIQGPRSVICLKDYEPGNDELHRTARIDVQKTFHIDGVGFHTVAVQAGHRGKQKTYAQVYVESGQDFTLDCIQCALRSSMEDVTALYLVFDSNQQAHATAVRPRYDQSDNAPSCMETPSNSSSKRSKKKNKKR